MKCILALGVTLLCYYAPVLADTFIQIAIITVMIAMIVHHWRHERNYPHPTSRDVRRGQKLPAQPLLLCTARDDFIKMQL